VLYAVVVGIVTAVAAGTVYLLITGDAVSGRTVGLFIGAGLAAGVATYLSRKREPPGP
jgi:O-antigen/teichoic acid export membrane protein